MLVDTKANYHNDGCDCHGNAHMTPLRKRVKSFEMPCRITGGLNGNGRLGTWQKPRTWPYNDILNNFDLVVKVTFNP